MLVLTSDVHKDIDHDVLAIAVDILKNGGVIAYATDTCYGFSCDATNKAAVDRLRYLKRMGPEKPISLMFNSVEMVSQWVHVPTGVLSIASDHWPGHLTLIMNKRDGMNEYANPHTDSIGCRLPACVFSHQIIEALGAPITTTSANISGLPQAYSGYEILKQFAHAELQPDLIIDNGLRSRVLPSTIIDVTGDSLQIVRQGPVHITA